MAAKADSPPLAVLSPEGISDRKLSFGQAGPAQAVEIGLQSTRLLCRERLLQIGQREIGLYLQGFIDNGRRFFDLSKIAKRGCQDGIGPVSRRPRLAH